MNAQRGRFRHEDYLGHMLDAIHLACSYVEGLSREDFLADKKTQQAVILNIVVIGEAATQWLPNARILPHSIRKFLGSKCAACATVWARLF